MTEADVGAFCVPQEYSVGWASAFMPPSCRDLLNYPACGVLYFFMGVWGFGAWVSEDRDLAFYG